MLSKLKYALDTFNHITTDRLCVGLPNFWYILLILSSFFFSLQILEYNVDFSTSKKDLFRRSFVSIISRARMDGRGPWQHRDEVARTVAQRSNTFLYKWTLWQRRKTEQSVKSSQDTACNKMGQSEWLVIDQHIHLPRPIFTFLSSGSFVWHALLSIAYHVLSRQTQGRIPGQTTRAGCVSSTLIIWHKYTNT